MLENIEATGEVKKILGNNNYIVEVKVGDLTKELLCYLSGKMRRFKINIIPGDEVTLEFSSPYDRGRITFRGKKTERPVRDEKSKQGRKRPKGAGGRR